MKSVTTILLCLLLVNNLSAVGSLQLGFFAGLYPDINNLQRGVRGDGGDQANGTILRADGRRDAIEYYDNLIQAATASGVATSGTTLGDPLGALWGVDLRYHWNIIFIRMAFDYASQLTATSGKLEAGGLQNKISYSSWAAALPITFGFSHALAEYFHFYTGFGPYYGISQITVSHSSPDAFANIGNLSLPNTSLPYKKMSLAGDMLGLHLLLGLQVPLYERKIFLSLDYMVFEARSGGIKLNGTNADGTPISDTYDVITQKGAKIILGLQYLLEI